MGNLVEIEKRGHITIMWLNRPEAFNALNLEMLNELSIRLLQLADDPEAKAIAITGRGKAFCGGGDLKWVRGHEKGQGAALRILAGQFNVATIEIRRMAKPVAAAVNGVAAGGGFTLALVCDYRIMDPSASLKQAYTSAGLSIDGGGTSILPKLVGVSRAMEIVTFDEPITAEMARKWGVAHQISEEGKALDETVEFLERVMRRSLNSFAHSKKLFNSSFMNSFEHQAEAERQAIMHCGEHPDGQEGVQAFIEKRKPEFNK